MPRPISFADVEIDVEPGTKKRPVGADPDHPFRILILGDFSGRANRGIFDPTLKHSPVPIDTDVFDDVLEIMQPRLSLPAATSSQAPLELGFRNLDDFHPDALYDAVELFGALPDAPAESEAHAPKVTLDDLLGTPPVPPAAAPLDEWDQMVHDIVKPHLVPPDDPTQAERTAQVHQVIANRLRAVLRQPAFQELEASWRALSFLMRRLEAGTEIKIYLLDVSKQELAASLDAAKDNLRASGLWRIVSGEAAHTPGAQPWSVVAGNYYFSQDLDDLHLLARLGAICRDGRAPFLAAAGNAMLDNLTRGPFQQLRTVSHAAWIGLAMPRWLVRLPYGRETSPIERFEFEEMPRTVHDAYLWGNPVFACLSLLAQAFAEQGWELRPGSINQLDGLPMHIYRTGGEPQAKPCAEVLMTEDSAEALLNNGIMPLVSVKDTDTLRLLRFQSIADPPAPLMGPWK